MLPKSDQHLYVRIGDFCIDHDLRDQFSESMQEEAEELWPDSHLADIRQDEGIMLAAFSVPSSAEPMNLNQTVVITINEASGIWSAHCDCSVKGGCAHVVAALMLIETDSGAALEVVDSMENMFEPR